MKLELAAVILLAAGCGGGSSGEGSKGATGQSGGRSSQGGAGSEPASNGGSSGAAGTRAGPYGKSCETLASQCAGESCCTSILVPGGEFPMGRGRRGSSDYYDIASDADVEHSAKLDGFYLDKFEVTVGRFREFLEAYDEWRAAGHPKQGEGATKQANSGWGESFIEQGNELPILGIQENTGLSATLDFGGFSTWLVNYEGKDQLPINNVSWHAAFAFCVWEGGRLPTEAEWEYAAAGGSENRLYPWGSEAPSRQLANFDCLGTGNTAGDCIVLDTLPVGSIPAGNGRFGHADLAGNMAEWVLDWYSPTYYGSVQAPTPCDNCTNTKGAPWDQRIMRGGNFLSNSGMEASNRAFFAPNAHGGGFGFRCARSI